MCQFLDVVHQAIELPLRIDLAPPAQRKSIQPFVVPNVAEYRFNGGKSSSVTGFAFFAVDGTLHPVAMAFFGFPGFTPKESDLPDFCLLRCAQAFVPLFAGQAIAQGAAVFGGEVAVVDAVRAVAVELFAGRTGADAGFQIECEVLWPVSLDRFLRVGLVVEWIGLLLVFALILEAFIALAHTVVRYQVRDAFCGQCLEIGFGVVASIGSVERVWRGVLLGGANNR